MFDPKVSTFAQYIENVYEVKAWGYGWDAGKKLKHLALVLPTGWCSKVFQEISNDNKKSYEALKVALIRKIDRTGETRQTAVSDFHRITQKPGESIDDFGHRIYRKCEEAFPTFTKGNRYELCTHRFVEGIGNPKLRDQLQVIICQKPKMPKFENLVDIARRLSDADCSCPAKQTSSVSRGRCHYCQNEGHFIKECHKRLIDEQNRMKQHPGLGGRCHYCQKEGHTIKQCHKRLKDEQEKTKPRPGLGGSCHYCHKEGHHIQDCHKRLKDEQEKTKPRPGIGGSCHYCHTEGHYIKDCHKRLKDQQDKKKLDDREKNTQGLSCSFRGLVVLRPQLGWSTGSKSGSQQRTRFK